MKSVSIGWLGSEMLTRRTATVTISAPDASTAAAFSSRLLYLPVPTISREREGRPATVQRVGLDGPAARVHSAASNEMHDLESSPSSTQHLAEASSAARSRDCARPRPCAGRAQARPSISATLIPPGTRRCSPLTRITKASVDAHRPRADRSGQTAAKSVQGGRRAHRLTERCAKQ